MTKIRGGYCCNRLHCKFESMIRKTLDAIGQVDDSELVFDDQRTRLKDKLHAIEWENVEGYQTEMQNGSRCCAEDGSEWRWAGILNFVDPYSNCWGVSCLYLKALPLLRRSLVDQLKHQQLQFKHNSSMMLSMLQSVQPCHAEIKQLISSCGKCNDRESFDSITEDCVRSSYSDWLIEDVLPTLEKSDVYKVCQWHIILHWEMKLIKSISVNDGVVAISISAEAEFQSCVRGFLALDLDPLLQHPGVDADRRLLRFSILAARLLAGVKSITEADKVEQIWPLSKTSETPARYESNCEMAEMAALPAPAYVEAARSFPDREHQHSQSKEPEVTIQVPELLHSRVKPGAAVVVDFSATIEHDCCSSTIEGRQGEVVGRKNDLLLVKFPSEFTLYEVPCEALLIVDSVPETCAHCSNRLGGWCCSTCKVTNYCSRGCQEKHWPSHAEHCSAPSAKDGVPQRASATTHHKTGYTYWLEREEQIDQINFAVDLLHGKDDEDLVTETDVWKALSVLEQLIEKLKLLAEEPKVIEVIEDSDGNLVADASSSYLLAKALISASCASGFLGQNHRAVQWADEALSLLAKLKTSHVWNTLKMEDPIELQIQAHLSRETAKFMLLDTKGARTSREFAVALCERYGLHVSDYDYLPSGHSFVQLGNYVRTDRALSESDEPSIDSQIANRGTSLCKCGERVQNKKMKLHLRRDCSQRQVKCPRCNEKVQACHLDQHMAEDCCSAPVPCELCKIMVAKRSLPQHQQQHCNFRVVQCENSGCHWEDIYENYAAHIEKCSFAFETCGWCQESMQARFMASHRCPIIRRDQLCMVCHESFGDLLQKSILPAIMLTGESRCCAHLDVCVRCATRWLRKAEIAGQMERKPANCPACRAEYDDITMLPPHLIVQVENVPGENRNSKMRLPRLCDSFLGSKHWVSPLDIHFTHAQISENFKDGHSCFGWRRPGILDTIRQLLTGAEPPELDCLDVVWYKSKIYVAGSGNRRLCMWRLLSIFYPERWAAVRVQFRNAHADPKIHFQKALDTDCEGEFVEIRLSPWQAVTKAKRFVGKLKSGTGAGTDPGVVWPEAWSLLQRTTV
eukprot:TRINITY_DN5779_c1_g2_i1.p1 TRINITY_DN5779_c1_g2~~TRINITY_DN5779_c1_g2_i1.p1  ORF type:complete len:1133 (-),score=194.20 TRINITY_DN5779_c1_g2_i1:412-3657(-)